MIQVLKSEVNMIEEIYNALIKSCQREFPYLFENQIKIDRNINLISIETGESMMNICYVLERYHNINLENHFLLTGKSVCLTVGYNNSKRIVNILVQK